MSEEERKVPLCEKFALTVKEAAAYFGIGERKIKEITDRVDATVLWVGTKRLIKRLAMESYLTEAYSV